MITKTSTAGLISTKRFRVAPTSTPRKWVRPADWLALPTVSVGEKKFVGLLAVYPGNSNWVAVSANGAYTVDWGDGTAPAAIGNGVAASHNYAYADVSGTDCTRGYRQAIVTITANTWTTLTLAPTRPTGMVSGWSSPWLDVKMACSTLTILTVSTTVTRAAMLERFEYVGPSAITALGSTFSNARSLQVIVGTTWTSVCTSFASMFLGCSSLETIPLLDTGAGTNFNNMFNNCTALLSIPLLNTALGTDFSSMFTACTVLQSVPLLNTALGTAFNSMFNACSSLQTIPLLNTAAGTNFISMFNACNSLQSVPALNTAAGTDFTTMFSTCMSLQSAPLAGTSKTISYASCKLNGTALNAIYTALASGVTAQTITVTGNWDVASDTPSIATNKGWTVTG